MQRWGPVVSLGTMRANRFRDSALNEMCTTGDIDLEMRLRMALPEWLDQFAISDDLAKWACLRNIHAALGISWKVSELTGVITPEFCRELVRLLDDPPSIHELRDLYHVIRLLCNVPGSSFSSVFSDLGVHEKILSMFLTNARWSKDRDLLFIVTCLVLVPFLRDCVPEVVEKILNDFFTRAVDWAYRFWPACRADQKEEPNPAQFSAVGFILSCIENLKVMDETRLGIVFDVVNTILKGDNLSPDILSRALWCYFRMLSNYGECWANMITVKLTSRLCDILKRTFPNVTPFERSPLCPLLYCFELLFRPANPQLDYLMSVFPFQTLFQKCVDECDDVSLLALGVIESIVTRLPDATCRLAELGLIGVLDETSHASFASQTGTVRVFSAMMLLDDARFVASLILTPLADQVATYISNADELATVKRFVRSFKVGVDRSMRSDRESDIRSWIASHESMFASLESLGDPEISEIVTLLQ